MFAADFDADAVIGDLAGAVNRLASLPLDELEANTAPDLLVTLCSLADRLSGEVARVASAVAATTEWAASGATSAAAFMSHETGMAIGRARAAIELGDAMRDVPALDDAVRSGELSPAAAAKVLPALDTAGFADIASQVIAEMSGMTPTVAERHVEAVRAVLDSDDDIERRRAAHERRSLTFRPVGDGMTHIEGTVPNETANSLRRTLKHLADQQRHDESGRTNTQRRADALGDLSAAYERGEVTGGRNLPRLIVTMDLDTFEQRRGVASDSSGNVVTAPEIDQLCCDAIVHRYVADQDGAVIDFGRGRRTASPQQFLALTARDQGCRHPGCDRPPEWCEAHHLREFAARGGLTNLDELVLLCHHHHHALHDSGWTLSGDATDLVFHGPHGQQLHSPLPRHVTTIAA